MKQESRANLISCAVLTLLIYLTPIHNQSWAAKVNIANQSEYNRHTDGHFYVRATINDTQISFLMDTGATKTILSEADARRLKIPLEKVRYTERFETPNGIITAAPVIIEKVAIGEITLYNVQASITSTNIRQSILGMNVISKLNLVLEGERMTLKEIISINYSQSP